MKTKGSLTSKQACHESIGMLRRVELSVSPKRLQLSQQRQDRRAMGELEKCKRNKNLSCGLMEVKIIIGSRDDAFNRRQCSFLCPGRDFELEMRNLDNTRV